MTGSHPFGQCPPLAAFLLRKDTRRGNESLLFSQGLYCASFFPQSFVFHFISLSASPHSGCLCKAFCSSIGVL